MPSGSSPRRTSEIRTADGRAPARFDRRDDGDLPHVHHRLERAPRFGAAEPAPRSARRSSLTSRANVLLGGLLALKEMSTKPDIIARWAAEGGNLFAASERAKDTGREALVVCSPVRSRASSPAVRTLTKSIAPRDLLQHAACSSWSQRTTRPLR